MKAIATVEEVSEALEAEKFGAGSSTHVAAIEYGSLDDGSGSGLRLGNYALDDDIQCSSYRSMIQKANSVLLNRLANALKEQDEVAAQTGRFAVIEYNDSDQASSRVMSTPQQLLRYFDVERRDNFKRRRLFILEDLPRDFVEILGSRLRLHPSAFARHWGDLSFLESLDEIPASNGDITRITIPFPVFMNMPKVLGRPREDLEELYRANFKVRRIIALPKPFGDWDIRSSIIEMESCFTYWHHRRDNGGWDAVILVDPPMNNKIHFLNKGPSEKPGLLPRTLKIDLSGDRECMPNFASGNDLSEDHNQWPGAEAYQNHVSMFDSLLSKYTALAGGLCDEPNDFAAIIRQIALSKWNKFLNHAIHCLVLTKGEPYSNNFHFNSPISALWKPSIEAWLLGRLVKWSRRLDTERVCVGTIMRALGMRLEDPSHKGVLHAREAEQWRYIRDKVLEYKSLYDDTTASYIQVMALREAQTSNKLAESIGRISIVGSLFVPVSLVTGIFSMSGDFAPGERHFWIFGVVLGPITVIICILLFTNAGNWLKMPMLNARSLKRKKRQAVLPLFHERHFHEKCT